MLYDFIHYISTLDALNNVYMNRQQSIGFVHFCCLISTDAWLPLDSTLCRGDRAYPLFLCDQYCWNLALLRTMWWWCTPPKDGEIALWPSTIPSFLILPGSELSITEITVYKYFSPLNPSLEFKYWSEKNTVPLDLIIEPILFLWNIIFTFYYTRVRPQCDLSILGRLVDMYGRMNVFVFVYSSGCTGWLPLFSSWVIWHIQTLFENLISWLPSADCFRVVKPGSAVVLSPQRAPFTSGEIIIMIWLFHVTAHPEFLFAHLKLIPILKWV